VFWGEEAKEEEDVGENAYNMKRSELALLERGHCMSGFLPREPLARTPGAEKSYLPAPMNHVKISCKLRAGPTEMPLRN